MTSSPRPAGRVSAVVSAAAGRRDVLTFSTAPLAGPVQVAGVPVVELFFRCDGECADIFARLCDVDVRGRSRNLTDQIIRLGRGRAGGGRGLQHQPGARRRVARVPAGAPDPAADLRRRVPALRPQPRHCRGSRDQRAHRRGELPHPAGQGGAVGPDDAGPGGWRDRRPGVSPHVIRTRNAHALTHARI